MLKLFIASVLIGMFLASCEFPQADLGNSPEPPGGTSLVPA